MSALLRRAGPIAFVLSAALLLFAAACDDPEEEVPADSPTESASVTPSAPASTATPAPTPRPTAPADWPEFTTSEEAQVSVRYPDDWYQRDGELYSFDPSTATGSGPENYPMGVEIEIVRFEAPGRTCAAIRIDLSGDIEAINPQATETTLGGQPAWEEILREGLDAPVTEARSISTVYDGYCVVLAAYYTHGAEDDGTFDKIADSFELKF